MANHEQDLLWVANPTQADFTVIWGKRPYTVKARMKQVYPRFIAEHFAKHLADKILLEQEAKYKAETGKQVNYLNSKAHRPPVVKSILVGVYQYFIQGNEDPNAALSRQITETNANIADEDKALDLGDIDQDKALGALEDFDPGDEEELPPSTPDPSTTVPAEPAAIENEPPVGHTLEEAVTAPNAINQGQAAPDEAILNANTTTTPPTPPEPPKTPENAPNTPGANRSINELRQEAKKLGLKITGRETKDALIAMIQNF